MAAPSAAAPAASQVHAGAAAPAASQVHAGVDADDPLKRKYFLTRHVIGQGADGGVVRGIDKETNEWHALKYLSRGGYGPEREIEALRKVAGHPNIVSLQGVFEPFGKRPQWVLAMVEADFTLHAFLQRSRGRRRLTEVVFRSLVAQLLNGISHIHENGMMHRDLKPQNIMLSVSSCLTLEADGSPPAASQAGLELAIGDFSRARQVPSVRRVKTKTSEAVGEIVALDKVMMSTMVCTVNYCAPEAFSTRDADISALVQDKADEGKALYGKSVDIWSFGAILFEILTMEFFAPGHSVTDCVLAVLARLGPWPARYGDVQAGSQVSAARLGLKRLQAYEFSLWWKQMLSASLVWEPRCRQTATQLKRLSPLHRGDRESEAAPISSTTPHSGGEVVKRIRQAVAAVLEVPAMDHATAVQASQICACAGHCYQPGHRWHGGCKSNSLVVGFSHCKDCICEVVGCGKPRLRGALCFRHKAVLDSLPMELRLTWASRRCASDLIPCGVATFLSHCAQYRNDLAKLLVLALLSDDSTMRMMPFASTGHLSGSGCIAGISERATTLVKSLIEVVQATARASEQGDYYFDEGSGGLLIICKLFSLVQQTTSGDEGSPLHRGSGSKDFRGGTAAKDRRVAYRIVQSTESAERFLQHCQGQSDEWSLALQQEDSALFLKTSLAIIKNCYYGGLDYADGAHARGCFVRALIFVGVTAGSLKNFGETKASDMCSSLVPELPGLIVAAESKLSMADMGQLLFARPSWGMFVPVFVLMWRQEVKRRRDASALVQLAASEEFAHSARHLAHTLGHNAPVGRVIAAVNQLRQVT